MLTIFLKIRPCSERRFFSARRGGGPEHFFTCVEFALPPLGKILYPPIVEGLSWKL